jgi:hypothetical protein
MENERLRQAKVDFAQEKDDLYTQMQRLEDEKEKTFIENRELKRRLKKYEAIYYGKK